MESRDSAETGAKPGPRSFVGCAGKPGQGPHMVIVLTVDAERIVQARFSTYGCPAAVACGQYVCDRVEGMAWTEAQAVDAGAVQRGVGNMRSAASTARRSPPMPSPTHYGVSGSPTRIVRIE